MTKRDLSIGENPFKDIGLNRLAVYGLDLPDIRRLVESIGKAQMKFFHPDLRNDLPDDEMKKRVDRFKKVTEAVTALLASDDDLSYYVSDLLKHTTFQQEINQANRRTQKVWDLRNIEAQNFTDWIAASAGYCPGRTTIFSMGACQIKLLDVGAMLNDGKILRMEQRNDVFDNLLISIQKADIRKKSNLTLKQAKELWNKEYDKYVHTISINNHQKVDKIDGVELAQNTKKKLKGTLIFTEQMLLQGDTLTARLEKAGLKLDANLPLLAVANSQSEKESSIATSDAYNTSFISRDHFKNLVGQLVPMLDLPDKHGSVFLVSYNLEETDNNAHRAYFKVEGEVLEIESLDTKKKIINRPFKRY